jgi:methanogenic corrinoid protein MtbC1
MADHGRVHYSREPMYNIKAVVQQTGIPADTVRAWERRYGVPQPQRTGTGRRLYSEHDIAAIRWLRERTAAGMTISQAIHQFTTLGDEALAEPPRDEDVGPRTPDVLAGELLQALLSYDEDRANAITGEAFALYRVEDVCLRVFSPVLAEIGDRWHRREATVAQEHFAAHFIQRRLAALLQVYAPVAGRGTILAACVPDEEHEIGLLMLSLFLARRAWQVVYLGASVPVADLLSAVVRLRPDLVCLSSTSARTVPGLEAALRALDQLPPPQPRIALGGHALNVDPALRAHIDGRYIGADAREAAQTIEQLLA